MVPSTIKKVLGTVKDQTSISIAKVSSNITPELDVAIVKATGHDEDPAEERDVREILNLTTYSRGNVSDCVVALSKRLRKTHDWIVALKSLMLMHRLLSNGHPHFQFEILHSTHKGKHLLNMSSFHDEAHSNSRDYTSFVRAYALYLRQRLRLQHSEEKKPQRPMMHMELEKVLGKMCQVQEVLDCVVVLCPTGIVKTSRLIIVALYLVARDSFQLYADLCEILAVLLDRFFDMEHADCVKSFNAYASAAKQVDELRYFYSWCKDVGVAKSSDFPEVKRVTEALLGRLEEHIRDRVRKPAVIEKTHPRAIQGPIQGPPPEVQQPVPKPIQGPVSWPSPKTAQGPVQGDLIDLSEDAPFPSGVEHESNGSALTLFSDDWEIALVESASLFSNPEANLANAFGPSALNSMYEQGNKQQILMQEQIVWQQCEENATNARAGFYFPPLY